MPHMSPLHWSLWVLFLLLTMLMLSVKVWFMNSFKCPSFLHSAYSPLWKW